MAVLNWQDRWNQSVEKKRLRCIKISITNIFHGCEGWQLILTFHSDAYYKFGHFCPYQFISDNSVLYIFTVLKFFYLQFIGCTGIWTSVNNWLEELLLFECLPTVSVTLCIITYEMFHCSPQVCLLSVFMYFHG